MQRPAEEYGGRRQQYGEHRQARWEEAWPPHAGAGHAKPARALSAFTCLSVAFTTPWNPLQTRRYRNVIVSYVCVVQRQRSLIAWGPPYSRVKLIGRSRPAVDAEVLQYPYTKLCLALF
jgi:hypothetical protein